MQTYLRFIMSKRKQSFEESNIGSAPKRFHRDDRQHAFRVLSTDRYTGSYPEYRQPIEINSYSIDADRRVWFDNRQLVKISNIKLEKQ
ncbi:hypothetical protein BDC45DRAFT_274041 [Circinella umbellata]|nr:hypothetical protein BDC45DRAFT_274041 [Circinella umbellata]